MEAEPDILKKRADAIGARINTDSPTLLYRGYTPIEQELSLMVRLVIPRTGYSARYASLQVTPDCNFACPGCNVREIRRSRQKSPMTTEEIFLVEERLKRAGVQWLDGSGGEPLTRRDLLQIIAHSNELGMKTTLNTNGGPAKKQLIIEKREWRDRAEAGLRGVTFSYDGIGEKTDPRVIELAAFLVNTLHIYGAVRTVVTKDNLQFVEEIGKVCMSNNVFFEAVPAVALGGEISALPNASFHPLDAEGRNGYIEIIQRLRRVRRPFARFLRVEDAYLKEVVSPAYEWHCKNPAKYLIFVNAYGELGVCNDRSLQGKTYSLIGDENPLLGKECYEAIRRESRECKGCRWLCNWRSQRRQTLDRFYMTAAALT